MLWYSHVSRYVCMSFNVLPLFLLHSTYLSVSTIVLSPSLYTAYQPIEGWVEICTSAVISVNAASLDRIVSQTIEEPIQAKNHMDALNAAATLHNNPILKPIRGFIQV